ncbi:MAG TPA: ABC transporter permease [Thermoanaerobaculia bacterium]|nr:ABC transporter permease [Thermoanaerobaculia bacterium]
MLHDLRHALRALRAAPGFTLVALFVLVLGIGATTAIFSVVDTVVLQGLPFDQADRLIAIGTRHPQQGTTSLSIAPQDYLDIERHVRSLAGLAATARGGDFTLRDAGEPEALRVQRVTADLFAILRVAPALGRLFREENEIDGNHRVALLSDQLWRQRFGADPEMIGRSLEFDDGAYRIVGVMPRGFTYPVGPTRPTELWVPYVVPENQRERGRGRSYYLRLVGRLDDGAALEQVQTELDQLQAGLAEEHPDWFRDRDLEVRTLHDALVGRVRGWMLMLLGAVALVLLIACVNVANLMLARATGRTRELGLRAALGASRWQIARGLLAESLLLSVAGTLGALLVAAWGGAALKASLPQELPRIASVGIDARVLGAAALAAAATGLLFGVAPALRFSRPDLGAALRDGGRGTAGARRDSLRGLLVIAEVAIAVVLLVGAGLFVLSFARLVSIDIGLDHRDVLSVGVWPRVDFQDPEDRDRVSAATFATLPGLLERIAAIPGVESAGLIAGGLPLSGSWSRDSVSVPGREEEFDGDDAADVRQITGGYPRAIRARLIAGRHLTDADTTSQAPVVVLNESAAALYLPDRDPIGAQIGINGDRTVIGVVADVRLGGPESEPRPEAYVPVSKTFCFGGELVIRSGVPPDTLAPAVKDAIWASFPGVVIPEWVTMGSLLDRLLAQRRFNMLLVGLFGALAILIAGVGLYGVMAYMVAQRTPEIGVRMALGARPFGVLRMILAHAGLYLAIGLALGVAGALGFASSIEGFLFAVGPRDARVYLAVSLMLLPCGLVAALVPALRAARVDPLIALRSE